MRGLLLVAGCFSLCLGSGLAATPNDSAIAPVQTLAPLTLSAPAGTDDYAKLAARLMAGDRTLDFRALRVAWLDSTARGEEARSGLDEAAKDLRAAMQAKDDAAVRDKAARSVSLHPIDFELWATLYTACNRLQDKPCADQALWAARGLVNSIRDTGDGKSCDTGWEVITVDEEYAMLRLLGAKFTSQALVQGDKHMCDVLNATDDKGQAVGYSFNIDLVWADEAKMLGLGK